MSGFAKSEKKKNSLESLVLISILHKFFNKMHEFTLIKQLKKIGKTLLQLLKLTDFLEFL